MNSAWLTRGCGAFLMCAVLVACGGGTLTVSEYAGEAEILVARMVARFTELDSTWESQPPSMEGALTYWDGRLAIRAEFLEGIEALDPPDSVAEQHAAALDVFTRITEADEALAARVAAMDEVTEHRQWLETPEGAASLALLEEVYAFCRASQADYDATQEREGLRGVNWLPSEMTEVVSVAFGCPEE
jgi:hypothetical protein